MNFKMLMSFIFTVTVYSVLGADTNFPSATSGKVGIQSWMKNTIIDQHQNVILYKGEGTYTPVPSAHKSLIPSGESTDRSLTYDYYDNEMHFNTQEFIVNCSQKTSSELALSGFMNDFLSTSCKDETSRSSTTSYCGCISKLTTGQQLSSADISKVMEDAFKAKFLKKLNNAIFMSLSSSDLVGYAEISNIDVRDALRIKSTLVGSTREYKTCSPGQISEVVDSLKKSQSKNSRCLNILNSKEIDNYSKKYINDIKSSTKGFSDYFSNLGEGKNTENFADLIDSISSLRLEKGLVVSGSGILRQGLYTNTIKDNNKNVAALEGLHRSQLKAILSFASKRPFEISDADHRTLYNIYRTNPYIRLLAGDMTLYDNSTSSVKSVDTKKVAMAIVENLNIPRTLRVGSDYELDTALKKFNKKIFETANYENTECLNRFAEIEKMCEADPEDLFRSLDSQEIAKLIDDVFDIDSSKKEFGEYVEAHKIGGLAFCHSKQCSGKGCAVAQAAKPQLGSSLAAVSNVGEFRGGVVQVPIVTDNTVVSSEVSVSSKSSDATDVFEKDSNTSYKGEIENIDEEVANTSGVRAVGKTPFSGQASIGSGNNTTVAATSFAINSESTTNKLEDKALARDPYYEKLLSELKEVKDDLKSSKEEQSIAKNELTNLKASVEMKAKEDELKEKERSLQNTISNLQGKISKLETQEKNVSKELSRNFPSGSQFVSSVVKSNKISASEDTSIAVVNQGGSQISASSVSAGSRASTAQALSKSSGISSFNSGRLLTLSGENYSKGSSSSMPLTDIGINDPSLSRRVIDDQGNTKVIFVKDDNKIYRISPSLDENGEVKIVNGQPVLIRELASVEQLFDSDSLIVPLQISSRLPASIVDDDFVGPILPSDKGYRYEFIDRVLNGFKD